MATRVTIKVDLERRIRSGDAGALDEIVRLLDAEREKREGVAAPKPGIGYKELVALLRSELGDDLLVPPNPSTAYIVRIVNRIKDYGFTKEDVLRVGRGVRLGGYRAPYNLDFVIGAALLHLQVGRDPAVGNERGVFTGRLDDTGEGGDDEI